MIPIETKEIDGTVFQVQGLDLRTERAVLVRLTKTLGPAIVELMRMGSSGTSLNASQIFSGLDESEVDFLIETFRKVTQVRMELANGEGKFLPCVDSVFKNGAASQFKWLWFCLEHQFASFLGSGSGKLESMLENLLNRLKAKASPSASPQS
jgi:hypothetical protein